MKEYARSGEPHCQVKKKIHCHHESTMVNIKNPGRQVRLGEINA